MKRAVPRPSRREWGDAGRQHWDAYQAAMKRGDKRAAKRHYKLYEGSHAQFRKMTDRLLSNPVQVPASLKWGRR